MGQFLHEVARHIERMGTQDYIIGVAIAIAIGYFCLRGFGSRSEY